jgi:hypothetical protein
MAGDLFLWFQYGVDSAQDPDDKKRPAVQQNARRLTEQAKNPAPAKYAMEPLPMPTRDEDANATYDTSGRKMS